MEVNEEKRKKFIDYAEKRVNNVMHDISILEPMARSNAYDFTRNDVEEMFNAMQASLDNAKEEFNKKFEAKARSTKQSFSFGQTKNEVVEVENNVDNIEEANSFNTEEMNNEVNNSFEVETTNV